MKLITILLLLLNLPFFIFAQKKEEQAVSIAKTGSAVIYADSSISILLEKEMHSISPLPLLVSGEKIFFADPNGKISCLDLNGNSVWEYETGGSFISAPAIDNDILAAATIEGDLFSIDAATGEVYQVIGLGEAAATNLIITDIVNRGNRSKGVILGTGGGKLYCYDLYTFEQIWENHSSGNSIEGKLLHVKDRIIFGGSDKFIYCVDAGTGIINWKWKNPGLKELQNKSFPGYFFTAGEKAVYAVDPQNNLLTCIDLLLGTSIWQKKEYKASNSIAVSMDKKRLFLPGSPGNFYIISAADGKLIKEIKMEPGTGKSFSVPAEWKNNILLGSSSGKIYLIDAQNNCKKIISLEDSINSIENIRGNLFASSGVSGKIIIFKIN